MLKVFFMMITLTVMLLFFLLSFSKAEAQDTVNVSIDKSKFTWNWEQGTGDMADFFRTHCALLPTGQVFMADTVGLIKEMPVNQVISIRGTYDCHVRAVNIAGESDPSNVVGLKIVGKADKPTTFRVEAN